MACNQQDQTHKTEIKDAVSKNMADTPIVQNVQPQETIVSYDSIIYKQYISQGTMDLINQKLPDWYLVAPNNWDQFWFKEYKKDRSLVNYMAGDFNCDQKQDYALVLADRKNELAVWVLQSDGKDYKSIKLHDLGKTGIPLEVGIEIVPEGNLNYIVVDEDDEDGVKSIELECPGIQVMFFEKSAVTYYWKNEKYHELQTGD